MLRYQIKKILGITLYLTVFQYSNAAPVFADSIGASFILLSVHTNPGILALREQYPRKFDAKCGYIHWGGRWVFPWTDQLLLDVGLGPSLIFRESWKKRFAELVADEEGFWVESDEFIPGYQYKWLIGGNLELQFEFATNWHAYWAVVPAINILVINSMGVKYSF